MSMIHPLAHVDPEAELGRGVTVGPFCHIAADVVIGDECELQSHVTLLGPAHFGTFGRYAYVGGLTPMRSDVPPYMKVFGDSTAVRGVNTIGMSRWGIDEFSIAAVKEASRLIYGKRREHTSGRTAEALREIEADGRMSDEHVLYLTRFLKRQMTDGVSGRAREAARRDSDHERERFYKTTERNQPA